MRCCASFNLFGLLLSRNSEVRNRYVARTVKLRIDAVDAGKGQRPLVIRYGENDVDASISTVGGTCTYLRERQRLGRRVVDVGYKSGEDILKFVAGAPVLSDKVGLTLVRVTDGILVN